MNRKEKVLMFVLAVVSGLVGGAVSSRFLKGQPAFAQKPQSKIVTAEEFRIVDRNGRLRARLTAQINPGGGWGLSLYDKNGKALRTAVGVTPDGLPNISLWRKDGKTLGGVFSMVEDGSTGISLLRDNRSAEFRA